MLFAFSRTDLLEEQRSGKRMAHLDERPDISRERLSVAEDVVENQRSLQVVVKGVFGGEADAGEDLLGVAGDEAGAAAGGGFGHHRREGGAVGPGAVAAGGRGLYSN